jgi:hypothetical protein
VAYPGEKKYLKSLEAMVDGPVVSEPTTVRGEDRGKYQATGTPDSTDGTVVIKKDSKGRPSGPYSYGD